MEKVCISFNFGEAQLGEIVFYSCVPSTRCLFQSIQCLLESAHIQLSVEGLKLFLLLNVNLFLNHSIKECCLHIHLMYLPPHLN